MKQAHRAAGCVDERGLGEAEVSGKQALRVNEHGVQHGVASVEIQLVARLEAQVVHSQIIKWKSRSEESKICGSPTQPPLKYASASRRANCARCAPRTA